MKISTASATVGKDNGRGRGQFASKAVIVLALAAGCVGFVGSSGQAFADAPGRTSIKTTATVTTQPQQPPVASQKRGPAGGLVLQTKNSIVKVTAGATGQGENQKQCDARARSINALIGLKLDAANQQNQSAAEDFIILIEDAESAAMDAGCFIVY
jgi:hypothetical protein